MAQVLIRDVAPDVVDKLKLRAKRNHRSLEAELRVILEAAVHEPDTNMIGEVEQVRKQFRGRAFDDSATLLRQDRDR